MKMLLEVTAFWGIQWSLHENSRAPNTSRPTEKCGCAQPVYGEPADDVPAVGSQGDGPLPPPSAPFSLISVFLLSFWEELKLT